MVPFSPFPFMFLFVFVFYHVWMGSNKMNWTEIQPCCESVVLLLCVSLQVGGNWNVCACVLTYNWCDCVEYTGIFFILFSLSSLFSCRIHNYSLMRRSLIHVVTYVSVLCVSPSLYLISLLSSHRFRQDCCRICRVMYRVSVCAEWRPSLH